MPAKEYRICSSDNPANLGAQVTALLSEGWQLYGHPFADSRRNGNGNGSSAGHRTYYQALTRGQSGHVLLQRPDGVAVFTPARQPAATPRRIPIRPARPRVPATFRNVAAFLAVILGGYLLCEALVFRSGLYAHYLEPEASAAGSLEGVLYAENQRRPTGKKEVLVIGNSRIAEGFSARLANQYKPEKGFWFVGFGVPATGCRAWYYMVRDADPHRNRYAAIAIPIDNYDDSDDWEDVSDRVSEVSLLINRLRITDILPYTLSFRTWKSRWEIFRRLTLKGLEYQRDAQAFLEKPGERLQRVTDFRLHGPEWAYNYSGIDRNMVGMQVDWQHQTMTFPPGIDDGYKQFLMAKWFSHPPQKGMNREFEVRWLGALADRYRGTKTRIILYQVPRSPAPPPVPEAHLPWTSLDELRKRPEVTVVDVHTFEGLEKPELFADYVHLNATGRKLFSPLLAETVMRSLHQ